MTTLQDREKKVLAILLTSTLLDYLGAGIIIPLLPFYAKTFGASPLEIGLLFSVLPFMGIFAPVFWGSLSDRIGRRPTILFNIAGTTLGFLCLTIANTLPILFLARIIGGAASASTVIVQSYISDLTTPEQRTQTLSFLDAAAGIGFILGPVIAGLLIGSDQAQPNFRTPGLAATIASGLTFCMAFIALPRKHVGRIALASKKITSPKRFLKEIRHTLRRSLIGSLILVVFAMVFVGMGLHTTLALWCDARLGWGPRQFGYLIVGYCLATAVIQIGVMGRLVRWLGEVKLILLSLVLMIAGLVLITFSSTGPQLVGAMLLFVVADATGNPTLTSLLSHLSGAKQQGKTLGIMESVSSLASCLGAIWGGFLFEILGTNWPYWINAILLLIGAFFGWQRITQSRLSRVMQRRRQQKSMHLFDLLDQDQNDVIELQDFQRLGQELANIRGWNPETSDYQVLQGSLTRFGRLLQQLADQDGNKKIDRAEWLHCLEHRIDYDFTNLFLNMIDADGDGQVTVKELRDFYQATGINTTELEESFDILDLNQDGHLCQEEFEKAVTQFLYDEDLQAPGNWIFGVSLPRQL
ncbi:MFS transporter [Leptothoe sp. LEGE 181152]|nr:MFS transporter [Leptothoe sp. LEGE 181152]